MRTRVDDSLRSEAAHYALRFSCANCAHWNVDAERCAEGFPNEEHRLVDLRRCDEIVFCKSFELC